MSTSTRFVEVRVGPWTFEADVAGDRAAPLVLLLHGFPQTSHTWREALPALLESAKGFVSSVIDPALVEERLQALSAQLGDTVHRDVAKYGRVGGGMGFSDHRMET